MNKAEAYQEILKRIRALVVGETDLIAVLSTIVCELHKGMPHFHWTGFYRVAHPKVLKVGPYQGTHGCLTIPFDKGVCGKCAREGKVQLVADVRKLPYHIACSSSTLSEVVIPVFDSHRQVRAVLDVDSDEPSAFDLVDVENLELVCQLVTVLYDTPFPTPAFAPGPKLARL